MGLFKRLLSKDARNATIPNSIPPPPPEADFDMPPLPPGQEPDLPDLSPSDMALPPIEPPAQAPPIQQQPVQPTRQASPPQYSPEGETIPGLRTAEQTRVLDEYEHTDLDPTGQKLPLGTLTARHAEDLQEAIPNRRQAEGPVFIRVNDYRMFIEGQNQIKNELREADNIITRLNEIKAEEDKSFEQWRLNLEEIQKKITIVDKKIFESG